MTFKLIVVAAAALALTLPTMQSASASDDHRGLICYDRGGGNCLDLYQGHVANGTKIIEWPYNPNDNAEKWYVHQVGTVSGLNCTPFDNCSLDRTHDGEPIDQIRYAGDTSQCAQNAGTDDGVRLEPCSGSYGVNWVHEGYSLVNVYLTNKRGSQQALTARGTQGYQVYCGSWLEGYSQWLFE